jgi:hypothetical protein
MQLSYKPVPHKKVDYYLLPNGYADVFLHRNEKMETNEEGDVQYVAEEVYFQVDQSVTKEQIELNFEYMWVDAEKEHVVEPTEKERIKALEDAIVFLTLGGI